MAGQAAAPASVSGRGGTVDRAFAGGACGWVCTDGLFSQPSCVRAARGGGAGSSRPFPRRRPANETCGRLNHRAQRSPTACSRSTLLPLKRGFSGGIFENLSSGIIGLMHFNSLKRVFEVQQVILQSLNVKLSPPVPQQVFQQYL